MMILAQLLIRAYKAMQCSAVPITSKLEFPPGRDSSSSFPHDE